MTDNVSETQDLNDSFEPVVQASKGNLDPDLAAAFVAEKNAQYSMNSVNLNGRNLRAVQAVIQLG